ncbi:hypothetical protein RDI58_019963 [Solanum bulbocastanum]|uniref:Uncharacterized protein n=1 Tax=Solanum bulbocastanum TaxID=147425 RepID=A0AAN8TBW9_SOLBU
MHSMAFDDTNIKEDQQPRVDKGKNKETTTLEVSLEDLDEDKGQGQATKRPTTTSAASGVATTIAITTGGSAANIFVNFASVAKPTSQFSSQQSTIGASGSKRSSKVKRGGANPEYKRPRTEKPRTTGFGVLFGANARSGNEMSRRSFTGFARLRKLMVATGLVTWVFARLAVELEAHWRCAKMEKKIVKGKMGREAA